MIHLTNVPLTDKMNPCVFNLRDFAFSVLYLIALVIWSGVRFHRPSKCGFQRKKKVNLDRWFFSNIQTCHKKSNTGRMTHGAAVSPFIASLFCQQIKKEYGSNVAPTFPPKKIFTLTPAEVEQRREQLEKYMQAGELFMLNKPCCRWLSIVQV